MLFNPDWNKGGDTSADTIFSLDALIAWLRQKNPNQNYNYLCNGECLLAQYFTDCGLPSVRVAGLGLASKMSDGQRKYFNYPNEWEWVVVNGTWTFGAALQRALAIKEAAILREAAAA